MANSPIDAMPILQEEAGRSSVAILSPTGGYCPVRAARQTWGAQSNADRDVFDVSLIERPKERDQRIQASSARGRRSCRT